MIYFLDHFCNNRKRPEAFTLGLRPHMLKNGGVIKNEYFYHRLPVQNKSKTAMNERELLLVSRYQDNLGKLLSCSKRFTLRSYNLRTSRFVYFKTNVIKEERNRGILKKEFWYRDGKLHRDEFDLKTGRTLPTIIWSNGIKFWYTNGLLVNNSFPYSGIEPQLDEVQDNEDIMTYDPYL